MIKLRFLIALIVSCYIVGNINAQDINNDQQKEIQMRVVSAIEEFQHGLSMITNDSLSHDIRKEHVNNILRLFIGEGDSFSYYDDDLERLIKSSGVKIKMSSTKREGIRMQQLLKKYIIKCYNLVKRRTYLPYHVNANIESADVVVCDSIVKNGDHFECTAYYQINFIKRLMEKMFSQKD